MDQIRLTEAQKLKLLDVSEGHFLDFKSARISPAKASQSISAFANADGGELLIGIEDAKVQGNRWVGFSDQEAVNSFVAVFTSLYPPRGDFSYEFLDAEGETGLVLRIEVFKNRQIWPDTSKDYYIRRGAQNLKLDHAGLRRLEYDKGLHSFEDQKLTVGFGFLESYHPFRIHR